MNVIVAPPSGAPCSDPASDAASMKGIPAGGPRWPRFPSTPSAKQGVGSRIHGAFASRSGVELELPDRVDAPQTAVLDEGAQGSRSAMTVLISAQSAPVPTAQLP